MLEEYWKQQGTKPLYEELEWNKPERRDQAGRMLVIGGNVHALGAPAKAYELAVKTGIGSAKIALPTATKRLLQGVSLQDFVFLPSTTSGEFSKDAAHDLLGYAQWADTLLLTGDNGRNSQTAILFEGLLKSYNGQVVVTRDAVDILSNTPQALLEREKTTLVVSFAQLQKLIKNLGSQKPLVFSMDLVQIVEFLHEFTATHPVTVAVLHQHQFVVAVHGEVITTKAKTDAVEPPHWRLDFATIAACYQTWNPKKPLESLTNTAHLLR